MKNLVATSAPWGSQLFACEFEHFLLFEMEQGLEKKFYIIEYT